MRPHLVLRWEGKEQLESVPIELANMMVSQSTFKDKERIKDSSLETITVKVLDKVPNQIRRENDGVLYRRYITNKDVVISVTNFELARVLFFHNQYLTRAAFSPRGLNDLAIYNQDTSAPRITFPNSTSYPVSNIKSKKSKSHLAWLLTNPHAIKSFFSIFNSFNGIQPSEIHDFDFTPPPLIGWEFELSGNYSKDGKSFWVSEILTITDEISSVPDGMKIKHPKLKQLLPVSREARKVNKLPPSDPNPELDLGELPKLGKRLYRKDDQSFSFNLLNVGNIGLEIEGDEERPDKSKMLPSDEKKTEGTSVGNATSDGRSQEFDYGLNRNEDDEVNELIDAEPTEKFALFERTIEVIKNREGFAVDGVRCGSFPPPKTGSRMVINTVDGKFLRYHMANIKYLDIGAIVIEADVDSLNRPKNISTLVVSFLQGTDPDKILKVILQDYSDLARGWNHDWIKKNTAICKFCRHPKKTKKEEKGERSITADEYVEAWAEILCKKLIHKASSD